VELAGVDVAGKLELTRVELVEGVMVELAEDKEEEVGVELADEDERVKAADELELEAVELADVEDAKEEPAEAELLVGVTTAVELDRLLDDTVLDAIEELLLTGHAGTTGSGHPTSKNA